MVNNIKKTIAGLIILAVLFQAPSAAAFGLTTIEVGPKAVASFFSTISSAVSNKVTAVFTGTSASANVSTAISTGLPGVSGAALIPTKAATEAACEPAEKLDQVESMADSLSKGFSFLGPNPAEVAYLNQRIIKLTYAKTCREAALQALNTKPILSVIDGLEMLRQQDYLNRKILSLDQRIENLKAKSSQSVKNVMAGIATKLINNLSKNIVTGVVNNTIAKYKINNYLQYADAVGTMVYTTDYIQKNYPNNQQQMILNSLLKNDEVGGNVLPLIRQETDEALGFVPEELEFSDPNYYVKLAQAGTGKANPFFMQDVYEVRAANAQAQGLATAQQEVSQSKGFASIRNCSNSLAQSRQLDNERSSLQREVQQKRLVMTKMMAASFDKTKQVDPKEVEQVSREFNAANDKLKNLPQTSPGSIQLCESLENPGGFIADSLSGYLNSMFNSSAAAKPENMPFWANFVSDLASNYTTNIIRGGKPNNQLLMNGVFQAANIAANDVIRSAGSPQTNLLQQSEPQAVSLFNLKPGGDGNNHFIFEWNVEDLPSVKSVILTGPNNFNLAFNRLSGTASLNLPREGVYNFAAYSGANAQGQLLASGQADIKFQVPNLNPTNRDNMPTYQPPSENATRQDIATDTYNEINNIPPDSQVVNTYAQCIANGGTDIYCRNTYGPPADEGIVYGAYAKKLTVPLRVNPVPLRSSN